MYAEKLILETDEHGHFKQLPRFPPNSKLEVSISILAPTSPVKRKPAAEIAGQGKILGDIMTPIVSTEDWVESK